PGGRSRNGAWGNWLQARQPREAGAPQARLATKEETRQAAQALPASVNAPGATRGDQRRLHHVCITRDAEPGESMWRALYSAAATGNVPVLLRPVTERRIVSSSWAA